MLPDLPARSTTARTKKSRKRQTKVLNEQLGKSLRAYVLAAGAGIVTLSPEAMAKIVYTPAHDSTVGNEMGINIDLNHDGIVDFNVHSVSSS
jgi:hypothetical protein